MTKTNKNELQTNSFISKIHNFIFTPKYSFRNVVLSILLGFVMAYIVLLIMYGFSGADHILKSLFEQNFLNSNVTASLIRKIVVIGFAGLAVGFGMKAGILNIGVSGQMTAGAFLGYYLIQKIQWFQNNNNITLLIMFFIVIITSILTSVFAGVLKAYFKVNEVISTIMINWIIVYFVKRFANTGMHDEMVIFGGTDRFLEGNQWLFAGISIGLLVVMSLFTWLYLSKTKWGFKTIATGQNESAAKYAGYNSKKIIINAFVISGLFAGIAGYIMFFLSDAKIPADETPIQEGFIGIAVALVAMLNPLAIIPSAIIFGLLNGPLTGIIVAGYAPSIVTIFSGIITYFVAITTLFLYFRPFEYFKTKLWMIRSKKSMIQETKQEVK